MSYYEANCPYCNTDSNWGGGPELFEYLWREHLEKHCDKCPTCGGEIKSREATEGIV